MDENTKKKPRENNLRPNLADANLAVSRLKGASAYIEGGHILFPEEKEPWWKEFEKELLAFPGCKFKDQVDAFTQCISYVQQQY